MYCALIDTRRLSVALTVKQTCLHVWLASKYSAVCCRRRLLKLFGWSVITVPYYDWWGLRTPVKRVSKPPLIPCAAVSCCSTLLSWGPFPPKYTLLHWLACSPHGPSQGSPALLCVPQLAARVHSKHTTEMSAPADSHFWLTLPVLDACNLANTGLPPIRSCRSCRLRPGLTLSTTAFACTTVHSMIYTISTLGPTLCFVPCRLTTCCAFWLRWPGLSVLETSPQPCAQPCSEGLQRRCLLRGQLPGGCLACTPRGCGKLC